MTYDEFRSALKKKDLTQLYFFTGKEDFLKTHTLADVKKAIIDPSFEDFNYKCYIETPSFEEVDTFINALPLMSEKKLVVFNKCDLFENSLSAKSKWEELFCRLPGYTVCLIYEKEPDRPRKGTAVEQAVKKMGTEVVFDYLPEARLRPWLIKAAASRGKSLSDREAGYIIKNLGQSMTLLKSEIEKICARAEEFEVTRSDIDSVIRNMLEENFFVLIDSVIYSRRDLAFETLANMETLDVEPVSVIPRFADQVLSIYKAKLMMTRKISLTEVKKAISRNPYAAERMVQKASKITISDLEKLINSLQEAEYKVKNGLIDPWNALYSIVAN